MTSGGQVRNGRNGLRKRRGKHTEVMNQNKRQKRKEKEDRAMACNQNHDNQIQ